MKPTLPLLSALSLTVIAPALAQEAKNAPATPVFETQTIDDALSIGYGLVIADVDRDGKDDILVADQKEIVWYQNPTWEKHAIANNLGLRDNVCLAAADADGDGFLELAVGANWNPGNTESEKESGSVYVLELRPDLWGKYGIGAGEGGVSGNAQAVKLPHEPTVHRMHWIPAGRGKGHQLVVLPLHGRGNDKKGQGENGSKIRAYAPPKRAADFYDAAKWTITDLPGALHKTHNFDPERGEGSPAGGMAVGGVEGLFQTSLSGKAEFLFDASDFEGFPGIGEVRTGPRFTWRGKDIRQYATIEPIHGNSVVVYEELTQQAENAKWKRTVLDASLNQGHALACADLLGTGREQVIAGWRKPDEHGKTGINLYAWTDDSYWHTHRLDREIACEALKVADLDGDGRQDIIACGRDSKDVKILWNKNDPAPRPALAGGWKKHELWKGLGGIPAAVAADFDGDGHTDVMFGANNGHHLLVGPDWKEDILITDTPKEIPARGIHCSALDVDNDGDIDFVGAPRMVNWLANPGGAKAREPGAWTYGVVDDGISGVHCVMPADVDGDGDDDILANEFSGEGPTPNSITWQEYSEGADGTPTFTRHVFAAGDAPGGNHYMGFGDIDGDGLPDISAGAKGKPFEGGNWFAWWKNPGPDKLRGAWEKQPLTTGAMGATCIMPADLDGDGDSDLFATCGHGSGILWFENLGKGEDWVTHDIDPRLSRPHCLTLGDLDGDGDMDAATCARLDRRTVWYENDGKGGFTVHDIDDDQAAYDIRAADMDGDGDLDLLVAGHSDSNVVWYENLGK